MKRLEIEIADIYGLAFGATMVEDDEYNEYLDDGILEDTPFELTDSIVKGPCYEGDNLFVDVFCNFDDEDESGSFGEVGDFKAFTTNKEIDESSLLTKEQTDYIKKTLKLDINDYYTAWRAGQSPGEDKLLEVEESGSGSMTALMEFEGEFDEDNLFFILGDTLPGKSTVISAVGYINPDGSISEGSLEYDDYSWYDPKVKCDGEELVF